MKLISKRLTYANVMSSIAVFLILGGATAFAAKKIGSNEIKGNSITTGKIKKEAVTAAKIKKNAITTAKIENGAVTGAKINLGYAGTVPSATQHRRVTNAATLRTPFTIAMVNRRDALQHRSIHSPGDAQPGATDEANCAQHGGQRCSDDDTMRHEFFDVDIER